MASNALQPDGYILITEAEFNELRDTPGTKLGGSFGGWVGVYDSEGRLVGFMDDSGYEPRKFCKAINPSNPNGG